jgi:FkbM family methyltransferase
MSNRNGVDDGLIYDVGAHLGEDSDFYLKLGYRVVAIEANPQLVATLRQKFRTEIEAGKYTIVPCAVGDANKEIAFYVNKEISVWGTADLEFARRNGMATEEIKVQCVRLADIIAEHGCPRYLKIDIEGADMTCVDALQSLGVRPTYVSIESSKTSWRELMNEFDTLEKLGYRKFKVVDQTRHTYGVFTTRNGGLLEYKFESDSSGPFGDDADGKWMTKRQAIARYIPIFFIYKTIGDRTLLRKIFNRLPFLPDVLKYVSWYDTHARQG